ncbi:MAG: aminotransferase class I/II-fold pyridoxal phosphate-dependent enzyme [Alcaligenaceae bacterium]|nr:MAG: aminotransferase class I/II-fold pyridoxal phosphate-dependent enzyme [Alcaligenaceae bacterium]
MNNMSITKYVKSAVLNLQREVIRDELAERTAYLRLDKNENLHAFDDEPFEAFKRSINQELIWGYPNLRPIYGKIAQQNGVGADQLLVANGSDVAIKAVFDACIEPGDQVILHSPSYFMYDIYAQLADAELTSAPVDKDWLPDLDKMLEIAGPKAKMMVIEDPSGFVGTSITGEQMRDLARRLHERGILLLIDEAYLYVSSDRSEHLALIGDFDNVMIARTMSKAHGMAGARVGFLLANAELMAQVYKCRPLYEISALSAFAAEWVLDHPEIVADFREVVASSKAKIFGALDAQGVQYRDTRGNFVLVHCAKTSAEELVANLAATGILVRRPFSNSLIADWVRVSVAGPWATRKFLEAFEKAVAEKLDDSEAGALGAPSAEAPAAAASLSICVEEKA